MADRKSEVDGDGRTRTRKYGGHRGHMSCDRCRSRKTKCIDPVPGPCRYCARIGATCGVLERRRKRPYYHVSEEEYRCSMRILEHLFPDRELNLESLKSLAEDVSHPASVTTPQLTIRTPADQALSVSKSTNSEPGDESETATEVVNDLHDPLGYLMRDSLGKYRYISPHSEIPFNAAVSSMMEPCTDEESAIIAPPKIGSFPPPLTKPSPSLPNFSANDIPYLPPRRLCDHYISRFFAEVHCSYWFYSLEVFHSRLEDTYSSPGMSQSYSWLCSLYSIFAIGADSINKHSDPSPSTDKSNDNKTPKEYISLAKGLVPVIYDEADTDSIRALAILSIACENSCFRVTSYLYVGASIQMAYSLGLHHDKLPTSGNHALRQQNRRLWWTLFILDQEIASRCGSPCLINERALRIDTPLPSEHMLYPGMHTPLSWLSMSVSLCRLKREIIQTIYPERSSSKTTISFAKVSGLLASLRHWYDALPAHLEWGVPLPPTQKRAVALLHIYYWSTTMLLSRPFLLYLVMRSSKIDASKQPKFEKLANCCVNAAQRTTMILQAMASSKTLSSLTAHDSSCILRVIMIFILAFAHAKQPDYRKDIEVCLDLLHGMEQVGFCKLVTEETPMRLKDLGILDKKDATEGDVEIDDDLITQLWGNLAPTNNLMTPMQSLETLDFAFGDSSMSDLMSEPFDLISPNQSNEGEHLDR